MGDGRFDQDRLIKTVKDNARDALLIDMDALAKQSGSIINAVMLGAIAGSAALAADRRAIGSGDPRRRQVGRRQPARLPRRARRRARETAAGEASREEDERADHARSARARGHLLAARAGAADRDRGRAAADRLSGRRLCAALSRPAARHWSMPTPQPARAGRLLKEVARHLAVRMSYEDVVRVAQAKIAPARMRRIAREELRVKDEPFSVHDFLKPGIEELCQLLPPFLARPILRCQRAQRLARPRPFRHGDQFHLDQRLSALLDAGQAAPAAPATAIAIKQEQAQIESWLGLIAEAARHSPATRARSRRMRPADQGLWRHSCARARQLPQHRGAA